MMRWIKYYVELVAWYVSQIKWYLIGIVVWFVVFLCLGWNIYTDIAYYKYTGPEWCVQQYSYMDDLYTLTSEMDDVYTLYLMGVMDQSDFKNEVLMFSYKYNYLYSNYLLHQKNHPVKEETWTWASKRGSESFDKIWNYIGALITYTYQNYENIDADTLAVNYLAFRDNIETATDEYAAALIVNMGITDLTTEGEN